MRQKLNEPQIAIIKLAAIGDVVIACRALVDFAALYDAQVTFHWIIDHRLESLAKAVVAKLVGSQTPKIKWHPIDSAKLFKGTAAEKIREAIDLFGMIRRIQPDHVALLHRDWRYRALLRPSFKGRLLSLKRGEAINELDSYSNCLRGLSDVMGLRSRPTIATKASQVTKNGTIGILVGGAQNQKLTYVEKRWPHMRKLVELLLSQTESRIALFGSIDDTEAAKQLINGLSQNGRIENFVGKLRLQELPEKIQPLDAFVSIDSGLAHIAAVLMTAKHQKVVTLFGPTNPKIWSPKANGSGTVQLLYKAKSCSPCYLDDGVFKPCTYTGNRFQNCMSEITPEEVLATLQYS